MSDLKPCPLCGHFAVEWPEDEWGDANSIACDATDCGVHVKDCEAPMDVLVDRWNRLPRHRPTQTVEMTPEWDFDE